MRQKKEQTEARSIKLERSDFERKKALQVIYGDAPILPIGGEVYRVPSLSEGGHFHTCNLKRGTCSCAKWRRKYRPYGRDCHHLIAAKLFRNKEVVRAGGAISDEELRRSFGRKNEYKNPPNYDFIATRQGAAILELTRCLTLNMHRPQTERQRGRPMVDRGDLLFGLLAAAYSGKSSRRAIEDRLALQRMGFTRGLVPSYNTILRYMASEETTKSLRELHMATIEPIRMIERNFAIDSKSLKTPYSLLMRPMKQDDAFAAYRVLNAKVHLASGIKTHAIVAVEVSDGDDSDLAYFRKLFEPIGRLFSVGDIYADAAYSKDSELFELVHAYGGRAFFNFNMNARPQKDRPHFNEMLDMARNKFDEWHPIYAKRNNAESTNSAFARTRTRIIRARYARQRLNEVLAHVIVYNLGALAKAAVLHDIEIPFADGRAMEKISLAA